MTPVERKKVEITINLPGALLHLQIDAHFVWAIVGSVILSLLMNISGYGHR